MKKIAFIVAAALLTAVVSASSPQQKYIEKWAPTAQAEMSRCGIPASITLAQGLLESNSGQSELAVSSNNHFGIKCHSDWDGRSVLYKAEDGLECFRAYSKAEDSFKDHSDFLRYRDRYKPLFDLEITDYKSWAKGLKQMGYATDPQYSDKLIKVIENYKLYLYDINDAAGIPASPVFLEAPQMADMKFKEEFSFAPSRPVYLINGVPCVYALEGETLESIARNNGLFRGEIKAYNDLAGDTVLETGDIVFLEFKKSQAARGVDKFVVGDEGRTTLYSVSQRFGIRLKALKKMNPKLGNEILSEGDTVILRKNK